MTRVFFATPELGVYLLENLYETSTVPRLGEEVCLKTRGGYATFLVEKISWYTASDQGGSLEARVQLKLCEG